MKLRLVGLTCALLAGLYAGCGGDSPTDPPSGTPAARVDAISPTAAVVGWPLELVMNVGGADFVAGSIVRWDGADRPTTFVRSDLLEATLPVADFVTQGTFPVTVVSPAGVVAANTRFFQVIAPEPIITQVSPTVTVEDEPVVLEISGHGFYDGSIARIGTLELPTAFVSANRIDVSLQAQHVADVGFVDVSVFNPEPGGGETDTLSIEIFPATPSITLLSSAGASAGRPGFDLHVYGSGFRPTTQVFWNGAPRPTTHYSHEQVSAAITAADVASPGMATITAENPAPSGPAPGSLELTIRSVGAPVVTSLIEIDLTANDIGYSAATGLLYAAVPGSEGAIGNTITEIDPATGAILGSVSAGSEPTSIAISDDGQVLWVSLDGSGSIRRIDLPGLTTGTLFQLSSGFAEELAVAPGTQTTVAVSQESGNSSPRFQTVRIYDDGVSRAVDAPDHSGSNSIAFDETGSTIYGYDNETSNFHLYTMTVDAAGVRRVSAAAELIGSFYARISYGGGRVFATSGEVVDARREVLIGNLGEAVEAIHVDTGLGRALALDEDVVRAIDLNTFQSLGEISFTRAASSSTSNRRQRIIRWGTDGLAFRDGVKVYIMRTPLAAE